MTKNDFVALADALRSHNRTVDGRTEFTPDHLLVLADFCASQKPNVNRRLWIDYIAGECGLGDELMVVESESPVLPGGIVKNKLESLKPRQRSSK
jgi:hypothetical protein